MRTRWIDTAGIALVVGTFAFQPLSWAAEHGGKEHAGKEHAGHDHAKEHGGTAMQSQPAVVAVEPTPEAIRSSISGFIDEAVQQNGSYTITDEVTGQVRNLELIRVHERVGKTGDYYYSCTDMTDVDTGETLDLDFDVIAASDGALRVQSDRVRIHKVNGQPRYTYDENDHMIPVAARLEPTQEAVELKN